MSAGPQFLIDRPRRPWPVRNRDRSRRNQDRGRGAGSQQQRARPTAHPCAAQRLPRRGGGVSPRWSNGLRPRPSSRPPSASAFPARSPHEAGSCRTATDLVMESRSTATSPSGWLGPCGSPTTPTVSLCPRPSTALGPGPAPCSASSSAPALEAASSATGNRSTGRAGPGANGATTHCHGQNRRNTQVIPAGADGLVASRPGVQVRRWLPPYAGDRRGAEPRRHRHQSPGRRPDCSSYPRPARLTPCAGLGACREYR